MKENVDSNNVEGVEAALDIVPRRVEDELLLMGPDGVVMSVSEMSIHALRRQVDEDRTVGEETLQVYAQIDRLIKNATAARALLASAIVATAPGVKRSERVLRGSYQAKVDHGGFTVRAGPLKAAWLDGSDEAFQSVVRKYCRIGSVSLDMRQVKPLLEAELSDTDDGPLARFVRFLHANEETPRPSVKVEGP